MSLLLNLSPASRYRRPIHQTVENLTHVLYRDVLLTLYPERPLPAEFAHRLDSIYNLDL